MKLTRKQLNQILLSLPSPKEVVSNRINPIYKVAVRHPLSYIPYENDSIMNAEIKTSELTFQFSYEEMDWMLLELDI